MSSLLNDLTKLKHLTKHQRVKININEKEFIALIPLNIVDDIISKLNEVDNISEEMLLNILTENNIEIE